MKVSLVSYTKPVSMEIETPTELVAFCARVSNPANQMNSVTSEKLIRYLIKNKHWSPLEMVDVTMEIETTRDIARQMLRHRSFSFQEFSQRYADVSHLGDSSEFDGIFEYSEPRLQDTKNRQNSIETKDQLIKNTWIMHQKEVMRVSQEAYTWALKNGVAKEVARKVLPEGLTKSRMYMKGSLRSWIHYLEVRGEGSGTQKEHMEVAKQIAKLIVELFPVAGEFQNEVSKTV
jgi:thymidylate synthase (FAD)